MFNQYSNQQLVNILADYLQQNNIKWKKTVITKKRGKKAQQIFIANDKILKNAKLFEFPILFNGHTTPEMCDIIISPKQLKIYGWITTRYVENIGDKLPYAITEHYGLIRDFSEDWAKFYASQKCQEVIK